MCTCTCILALFRAGISTWQVWAKKRCMPLRFWLWSPCCCPQCAFKHNVGANNNLPRDLQMVKFPTKQTSNRWIQTTKADCTFWLLYVRRLVKILIRESVNEILQQFEHKHWNFTWLLFIAGDVTCAELSCCREFGNCVGSFGGVDCFCGSVCELFDDCCPDYATSCQGVYKHNRRWLQRRATHRVAQYAHKLISFLWTSFS